MHFGAIARIEIRFHRFRAWDQSKMSHVEMNCLAVWSEGGVVVMPDVPRNLT